MKLMMMSAAVMPLVCTSCGYESSPPHAHERTPDPKARGSISWVDQRRLSMWMQPTLSGPNSGLNPSTSSSSQGNDD